MQSESCRVFLLVTKGRIKQGNTCSAAGLDKYFLGSLAGQTHTTRKGLVACARAPRSDGSHLIMMTFAYVSLLPHPFLKSHTHVMVCVPAHHALAEWLKATCDYVWLVALLPHSSATALLSGCHIQAHQLTPKLFFLYHDR